MIIGSRIEGVSPRARSDDVTSALRASTPPFTLVAGPDNDDMILASCDDANDQNTSVD